MSRAYVLLFDGYADWELGHVLAELRRMGKVEVVAVGFSDTVVVSMGGLHVMPDVTLSEVDIQDVRIFILPGGCMWEKAYPRTELEQLLHRFVSLNIPVAAICAATTVIARAGLLKNRKHTSNSLKYLSTMAPEYAEGVNYVD